MSSSKGKRPLRHLNASDKIGAIARIHDGESKASVARDIGVPESTLRGWCKNEDKLRYMARNMSLGGAGSGSSVGSLDAGSSSAERMAHMVGHSDDPQQLAAAAAAHMYGSGASGMHHHQHPHAHHAHLAHHQQHHQAGPAEKRIKLESSGSGAHNLSARGRPSMGLSGALDYSSTPDDGALMASAMGFGSSAAAAAAATEYQAAYKAFSAELMAASAHSKEHILKNGGDMSQSDMAMAAAAISPLSSLSHLTGMGLNNGRALKELANSLSILYNNPTALSSMAGLAQQYGGALAAQHSSAPASASALGSLNNNSAHAHNNNPSNSRIHNGSSSSNGMRTSSSSATASRPSVKSEHLQQSPGLASLYPSASSSAAHHHGMSAPLSHSPRQSGADPMAAPHSLTVKNLAKMQQHKTTTPAASTGISTSASSPIQPPYEHGSAKRSKTPSAGTTAPSAGSSSSSSAAAAAAAVALNMRNSPPPAEDPIWYWLRSSQAITAMNAMNGGAAAGAASDSPSSRQSPLPLAQQQLLHQHFMQQMRNTQSPSSAAAASAAFASSLMGTLSAQLPPTTSASLGGNKTTSPAMSSATLANFASALASAGFDGEITPEQFFEWYKSIGISLMDARTQPNGSKASPSSAGYLPSAYDNILFAQLTKEKSAAAAAAAALNTSPSSRSAAATAAARPASRQSAFSDAQLPGVADSAETGTTARPIATSSPNQEQRRRRLSGRSTPPPDSPVTSPLPVQTAGDHRPSASGSDALLLAAGAACAETPSNSSSEMCAKDLVSNGRASSADDDDDDDDEDNRTLEELKKRTASVKRGRDEDVRDVRMGSPTAADGTETDATEANGSALNGRQHAVRSVLDQLLYQSMPGSPAGGGSNLLVTANGSPSPVSSDSVSNVSNATSSSLAASPIEHGEKFLEWLETASDPTITAMQVMQFRTLLASIKRTAERVANASTPPSIESAGGGGSPTTAVASLATSVGGDEGRRSRKRK